GEQGGRTLTLHADGEPVSHCGLLLDRAGARTGTKRRFLSRGAEPALAVMPSLGAMTDGADTTDPRSTCWLVPGEPRKWTLTLSVA
ncbi:MAG: hypothetical protein ACO3QC_08295, partial [Phycisphaerales bacterium]